MRQSVVATPGTGMVRRAYDNKTKKARLAAALKGFSEINFL